MKRKKAILCAVASFGLITAANTINANAMTMTGNTSSVQTVARTASEVKDLINNLPYTINFDTKAKFEEAINAYNSLNSSEKSKLELYILDAQDIIESAEKRLKDFEAKVTEAEKLVKRIDKLKAEINYFKDDKGVHVDKAKLLAHELEIRNISDTYYNLSYHIKHRYQPLANVYEDFYQIECKLSQAIWGEEI